MRQITVLLFLISIQNGFSQATINPAWEQLTGIAGQIIGMGHTNDKILAVGPTGIFTSSDTGRTWNKTQTWRTAQRVWARNRAVLILQQREIFPNGYNSVEFRMYRSVDGGNLQSVHAYNPNGAMGYQYGMDMLWADDTTLCRLDRTTAPINNITTVHFSVSSDMGLNWSTTKPYPNGTQVVGCTKSNLVTIRNNILYFNKLSNLGLTDSVPVPIGLSTVFKGGFVRKDSVSLCFENGFWLRYIIADSTWTSGFLPFSNIQSVWAEEGYCYVQYPGGFVRATDLSSLISDFKILHTTPGIFRAGNTFFRQATNCVLTEQLNVADTLEWQPVRMLGFERSTGIRESRGAIFASSACWYKLCGNIFEPLGPAANPILPQYFQMGNYAFQTLFSGTNAVLRSSDFGETWDTVLTNPGFFGQFQKGAQRLFLYNTTQTLYSDDYGAHWEAANWGAAELWAFNADTLLRRLIVDGNVQYDASFDGGLIWTARPDIPPSPPQGIWQSGTRLTIVYPSFIKTSADWGLTWTDGQFIASNAFINLWWTHDSIGILQRLFPSTPVCQPQLIITTDGGANWSGWSETPFWNSMDCGMFTSLANYHFANQYLVHDNWLYASSNMSGVWRTPISALLQPQTSTILTISDTLCAEDTPALLGYPVEKDGIYQVVQQSISGCDTLLRYNLTISPNPVVLRDTIMPYGALFLGQVIAQDTTVTVWEDAVNQDDCAIETIWNIVLQTVDIQEVNQRLGWSVYPNPASDKIWVTWEDSQHPVALRLYDSKGQLCVSAAVQQDIRRYCLDIPDHVSAMYWLEMLSTQGSSVRRIMVLK